VGDRREGTPSDYYHAGEGDILALLYEKVIKGNGDDSLLISRAKMQAREDNIEVRMDKVEKKQDAIFKLAWAILIVLLGTLGETIRADATRPTLQPAPPQHSDLYYR